MTHADATLETTDIVVPIASRVMVRSGLLLGSESTKTTAWAAQRLSDELNRWQGTGLVIIAGKFFSRSGTQDVSQALAAHPELSMAIDTFLQAPGRRFLVIPGSADSALKEATGIEALRSCGIEVHAEIVLACETAAGLRRILILATDGDTEDLSEQIDSSDQSWLEGINHVEDRRLVRRFVSSRALYRRLSRYLWIPAIIALLAAIVTRLAFVGNHLRTLGHGRSRHLFIRVADAPWHVRFLVTAVLIIVFELIVGLVATVLSRRVFASALNDVPEGQERGVVARSESDEGGDQALLDVARSWLNRGGAGIVVGGPKLATLTHLDAGFFASPGSTGAIAREHHGRVGLPPVFLMHRQEGVVEFETGAELHTRLMLQDERLQTHHRLERLVAGETCSASPAEEPGIRLVAAWPTGGSWPPPPDFSATQRSTRRIRRIAAVSIFITGLLDLLVAVAPPLRAHLHTVLTYLPLGISQSAAVAVAIAGLALVMLSRGILRGQRRPWIAASVLLAVSTALHLAHAASVGALLLSAAVLVFLLVERRHFTGTTDRSSLRAALPVIGIVLLVSIGAAFFGIEVSNLHRGNLPSWPLVLLAVVERLIGLSSVALPDKIDDFVYPSMLTIGIAMIATILYLATRPVVDRRLSEHHRAAERRIAESRARDIVRRHGRGTLDYFALRDDKQYFFYGDSLVAYAVYGGICLVSPDPIGPEAERTQVWGAFRSFCDAHGWGVSVIGAGEAWLPIYDQGGMRWLYLGDEAIVDLPNFSLQGGKMKGLRQANTRVARNGYTCEFLDPATIDPARVPGLAELMGMNRRGEDERGFSMMLGRLFDPKDTGLVLAIVTDGEGVPAAMCQFVPSPGINGYSLDLMRRDPGEHPNGLLDFALCQSIEHFKQIGATRLSLNFAAFRSILDGEKGDGLSTRVERWGLKRLSSVFPIETLWRFNEKYQPSWQARYLVYASPESFIPTVMAAMRAESLTELPLFGRLLAQDPANRPGTVVPPELLEGRRVSTSADD